MIDRRIGWRREARGLRGAPATAADPEFRVAGSAAGTSSASGPVFAHGAVEGASVGSSSAQGTASAHGAVAGASAGTSSASGTAYAHGAVAGTAAGTSTAEGTVTAEAVEIPTTDLVLHVDATSGSNTVSSGEVTVLADLSGSGNSLVPLGGDSGGQIDAAGAPSGLDCIDYNGTDESNFDSSPSGLVSGDADRTIYWVGRAPDVAADVFVHVYGELSAGRSWAMIAAQDAPDRAELNTFSGLYESDTDIYDAFVVWCVKYVNSTDTIHHYINGASAGSETPTNIASTSTPSTLGFGANLGGDNSPSKLCECAHYSAAHDDTERGAVEDILGAKWGITIS